MPSGNTISVVCDCGKKLKAPASAAGKRARCPVCGEIHVLPQVEEPAYEPELELVEAPAARSTVPPQHHNDAPPEEDDLLGAMYELADQEKHAAVQSSGPVCPSCYSPMNGGTVLCINCGYDTRTGKSAAKSAPAAPQNTLNYAGKQPAAKGAAGKKKDYMAPEGSLALGVIYSGVFALVASLLWVAVAYFTGYMIAYIAALVGVAAGIGMQAGHKGQSQVGGMIAGAMTFVAIIFAKIVVLYLVLQKMGIQRSMFDLDAALLGMYFFRPISLIIMVVGIGAAYKCAAGVMRD